MNNSELYNETNRATYCPESNTLHLYVGRVPREEYLALKAEGWRSTPKQSEAGGGEFAATWTPARRDTCVSYAGIIEDEDQGPEERAADRAERFSGYLDKRLDEATGHADRYDAGPSAHGYQSKARAVRAADRHDRIATKATDAWSKAEYWQQRTAGVIANALYKSTPAVRMGRIKELETELRRFERSPSHYPNWIEHAKLRLAYENQMLEAVGGRASLVEMEAGGWIGSHQIQKVNKSNASGNVVSVEIQYMSDCNQYGRPWSDGKGSRLLKMLYNVERLKASVYRAPTPEEKAAFLEAQKVAKKERAATAPKAPPLINPTVEDAERLQAALNAHALADHCARHLKAYGRDYADQFKPSTVCLAEQAYYSARSKGSYASAETRGVMGNAELEQAISYCNYKPVSQGVKFCEVRTTRGDGSDYGARRVIVLTDKPQKPLPKEVWEPIAAPTTELVTA